MFFWSLGFWLCADVALGSVLYLMVTAILLAIPLVRQILIDQAKTTIWLLRI
jgi:hypothetical protein